jgi:hypothetical protein
VNPEYEALGDPYWTPDIISRLWYQAETGKIPVSGAGYPGPFSGPGFDEMWTDMSEIVRPTRDGIHGREYISTAIDLGRTPEFLRFSKSGEIDGDESLVMSIPLPIIMKFPAFGAASIETIKGWTMAARRLGTLMALPHEKINASLDNLEQWLMPVFSEGSEPISIPKGSRVAEIPWAEESEGIIRAMKKLYSDVLISVRIPMAEGIEEKTLALIRKGISIIHLEGSPKGRFQDDETRYLKDGIGSVHRKLVDEGVRDNLTLLASGGISMAEHVAKSMICGADAVFVDFPILIALECKMCRRCTEGLPCPVETDGAPSSWVTARVVNLLGAWHNQLLEVMGAMGIRDARRLRGEAGRAMFFEDLDRATFESLGEIEEGCHLE